MTNTLLRFLQVIRMVCLIALAFPAGQGFAQQALSSAQATSSAQSSALPVKSTKPAKKTPVTSSKTAAKAPLPASSSADAAPGTTSLDATTVRGRRVDDHPNIHSVFEKAFPQPDGSATSQSTDAFGNRVECIKNCSAGSGCCKTVKANLLSGPDPNGPAGH